MRTKNLADPGAALFGKVRLSLLTVLFGRPAESFYLRQLARLAGASAGPVQRELAGLTAAGIVSRRVQGRLVFFQANRDCPIFAELSGIAGKAGGQPAGDPGRILAEALAPWSDRIRVAAVTVDGAGPGAAVSLLVVGKVGLDELGPALAQAEESLGRPVTVAAMRKKEFRRKLAAGDRSIGRMLSGQWSVVAGDEAELTRRSR